MIKQLLKKTFLFRLYQKSAGNWRYPLLALNWKIANFLTRRRNASVNGLNISLPVSNWITHFRWFLYPKKESEVRDYIDKYVDNGDVFFDIGANIGVFSLYAGKRHQDLKIYCFEPEYSNLNLLKDNVIANRLSNQVNIYSVGVSDFVGFSQLHLQDIQAGAAAHTESQNQLENTDEGFKVVCSEGIATSTVDHLSESLGVVPNYLKIDTDGNELKILNGAKSTLKSSQLKSLIIEMPSGEKGKQCAELLAENNFKMVEANERTRNQVWARA